MSRIREIIERESGRRVSEDTSIEQVAADSLELLDLLQAIEQETGVIVPDDRIAELNTVGDIERFS